MTYQVNGKKDLVSIGISKRTKNYLNQFRDPDTSWNEFLLELVHIANECLTYHKYIKKDNQPKY